MDEQKPLENEQGEPGEKTEKSEYSFMQETIKDDHMKPVNDYVCIRKISFCNA